MKRENRFGLWLKKFFKDYKSELKKIVWASKDFTVKSTIVVIVCLLVCAGVIGLLDFGLSKLLLWLLSLVG
ncbi:MAG: preprotein translocase subunit SecE [Clostridia bacterium]|nr:preprotein translocase subunit SecE [Clostridia bacterium]